jgi:hypothetical protein
MKVTKDVIYDLLPGYFAGDVSADTRTLIDEFLATDPEFARMTTKFHRLFAERASESGDVTAERGRLERARRRAEARQISAAFTIAFGLAAVFPFALDMIRGQRFAGTFFLAAVFGVTAFGSALAWVIARMRPV